MTDDIRQAGQKDTSAFSSTASAVMAEIRRLRPHYASNTATDAGRRQMLDHFEKLLVDRVEGGAEPGEARIAELLEANNRYLQEARDARALLKSYMAAAPRVLGFFRHLRRGSTYGLTAKATAQCSTRPIVEGDAVAVYVDADGRSWVRRLEEFQDGRFEKAE